MNPLNVYAEVRGKYARPAPPLNKAVKKNENNPVLSRPSTAGSLRPKSSLIVPEAKKPEDHSEILSEKLYRPKSSHSKSNHSSSTRKSYRSIKEDLAPQGNRPKSSQSEIKVTRIEFEKNREVDRNEIVQEDIIENYQEKEEEQDVVEELVENIEDIKNTSRSSWKTTSSQRRYIEELETLLREEKLKRIKLEQMLSNVISK